MDHQISKLVKRGHDAASELKASCGSVDVRAVAQLLSDLATQLDVNRVALAESRREFAAANATIHNLEMQLADAEARGVEKFSNALRHKGDDEFLDAIAVVHADVADKFAAQLRQGAEQ